MVSYAKTGQFDQARELATYGATNARQFANLYQAMLDELPALEATMKNAAASNTPTPTSQSKK